MITFINVCQSVSATSESCESIAQSTFQLNGSHLMFSIEEPHRV
jgi:hypothetical protein